MTKTRKYKKSKRKKKRSMRKTYSIQNNNVESRHIGIMDAFGIQIGFKFGKRRLSLEGEIVGYGPLYGTNTFSIKYYNV